MDSEQLSTSHCCSSEHTSVLLVLETLMEKTFAGDYVLKKEKSDHGREFELFIIVPMKNSLLLLRKSRLVYNRVASY